MTDDPPLFTRQSLPVDVKEWPRWQKKALTPAIRILGVFRVETPHGTVECQDGWLALDAEGWPYPVAATEFDKIYEQIGDIPQVTEEQYRHAQRAAWLAERQPGAPTGR